MSWARYALRRLFQMVPLLWGIITISFVITHALPGDVAAANLGQRAVEEPGIVAAFKQEWGLDRPLVVQYLIYLRNLLSGNLGRSIATRRPVATDLGTFLPATVELATLALLVSLSVGIPLGVLSAVRRGRSADHLARLVSLIGVSAPVFWLGLAGLFLLYFRLRLLPGPGRLSVGAGAPPRFSGLYLLDSLIAGQFGTFCDALAHLVLPALVLGSYSTGLLTRVTRASLLEVLSQDY
ncbi:MAG: ABC transporter permease, partial [Deinococcus sp.]|nr:ABC transporter permease [Deinococcus sp.]